MVVITELVDGLAENAVVDVQLVHHVFVIFVQVGTRARAAGFSVLRSEGVGTEVSARSRRQYPAPSPDSS